MFLCTVAIIILSSHIHSQSVKKNSGLVSAKYALARNAESVRRDTTHTRKDERAVVVVFVVDDVEGGGGRTRDAVYRTLFFVKTGSVDEKT